MGLVLLPRRQNKYQARHAHNPSLRARQDLGALDRGIRCPSLASRHRLPYLEFASEFVGRAPASVRPLHPPSVAIVAHLRHAARPPGIESGAFVREKSKIPISVTWEGGMETYSGLLDVAMEGGYVVKPTMGWYSKVDKVTGEIEDKKVRQAETLKESFWKPIFANTDFKEFLKRKYEVGHADMIKTHTEEDV